MFIGFYWFLLNLGFSEDEHGVVPSSQIKMAQTSETNQNTNVKWPPMCNHEIYDESQPIVF